MAWRLVRAAFAALAAAVARFVVRRSRTERPRDGPPQNRSARPKRAPLARLGLLGGDLFLPLHLYHDTIIILVQQHRRAQYLIRITALARARRDPALAHTRVCTLRVASLLFVLTSAMMAFCDSRHIVCTFRSGTSLSE